MTSYFTQSERQLKFTQNYRVGNSRAPCPQEAANNLQKLSESTSAELCNPVKHTVKDSFIAPKNPPCSAYSFFPPHTPFPPHNHLESIVLLYHCHVIYSCCNVVDALPHRAFFDLNAFTYLRFSCLFILSNSKIFRGKCYSFV